VPNVRGVLSPVPWPVRGDHILSSLQKGSPGVGRPGCMAWAIPAATLCTVLNGIREGRTDNSGHRITKKENVRPSTHRLLHDGSDAARFCLSVRMERMGGRDGRGARQGRRWSQAHSTASQAMPRVPSKPPPPSQPRRS
jgi:hypothetical protein